jgi:rod shape-determining protein MreB and related proteins
MHEKTHINIKTIKPLKDGVIADYYATEQMIRGFLQKIPTKKFRIGRKRFLVCIPYATTEVEKRAVRDSAQGVGASELYMIHEPIAAAVGMGLDVRQAEGKMVVDIGGGTTEIVILSLSGIVCSQSLRIAGNTFDGEIIDYVRRNYNILIGERTAERIKIEIGAVLHELDNPPPPLKIVGRDLMTGIPKAISLMHTDVVSMIDKSITKIEEGILHTLEVCPPELAADIYEQGIYLTGGGAYLRGLDKRISQITKLPVKIAPEPLLSVMKGVNISLKNLDTNKNLLLLT